VSWVTAVASHNSHWGMPSNIDTLDRLVSLDDALAKKNVAASRKK
jgi:hypothetical protein